MLHHIVPQVHSSSWIGLMPLSSQEWSFINKPYFIWYYLSDAKEKFMAKGRDAQKSGKKKPAKTMKEKRKEKKAKKK